MEAPRKKRPEPNRRVGRLAPAGGVRPGARRPRLGLRILGWSVVGGLVAAALTAVGLALVLVFVGIKMAIVDVYKIPIALSLGMIAILIGGAIVASLLRPRPKRFGGATTPIRAT